MQWVAVIILAGVLMGVFLAGLLSLVQHLARLFREKAPRAAKITGNALFWIATVAGIYELGMTGYALYQGAPAYITGILFSNAVAYFVVGYGARYLLARTEPGHGPG